MMIRNLTLGADVAATAGSWLAPVLALAIASASAAGFRHLRGTTLGAPAAWSVATALLLAAVEASLAWRGGAVDPLTASLGRYAAAVGTFCPLMAVLGAKRPQDRGWQWVVVSLWIVLLVPAGQALAAPSGNRLELFAAWRLLLAALVAMGLLNYLPTRFAIAAVLCAIGQTLLLASYLVGVDEKPEWVNAGLVGIISALAAVGMISPKSTVDDTSPLRACNARWFAFRDGWGAFWALRVLQRVNQAAALGHWPVRLHWWTGFEPHARGPQIDVHRTAPIEQTLDSLLRRFERLDEFSPSDIATHK